MRRQIRILEAVTTQIACALLTGAACAPTPGGGGGYNNTTDRTNGGASYIGSQACRACHPDLGQSQLIHGHSQMLKTIEGVAPTYPSEAAHAGVPNPPTGFSWDEVSYVIGGYISKARFIDTDGYLLTTGFNQVATQWNLSFPPSGTTPGFVAYEPGDSSRMEYDYSCFLCHTTGPAPRTPSNPQNQDNRPGILGTWKESGVQCEACHGPGSHHVPDPSARNEFVDTSARFCGECHSLPQPGSGSPNPSVIQGTGDGFIENRQQWPELLASGGHAGFNCVTCHNPHVSANYSAATGFINVCLDCHTDKNMGFHQGVQYVNGDYTEALTCVSCHMPYATRSATSKIVGDSHGRVGDMKTHIFRIDTNPVDYTAMFTSDMTSVQKDTVGRAAVTVDFVCLRCHNTDNGYPFRLTVKSASEIALGIHGVP
jgi:predicted CXXCH cytochrome family protein